MQGHAVNNGRFRTDNRKYFITQCLINLWNPLPGEVMIAANLDYNNR